MALTLLLLSGCAQAVRIESLPPGARCEIEGSFVGYTPVELHLSSSVRDIRLECDGYRDVTARLHRRFDLRSLGLIPVFPLLCIPRVSTRLEPLYRIELEPGAGEHDLGIIDGDE
jgi:hypothetical protein